MADTDISNKLDTILERLDGLERRQELYFEQTEALMNLHTMLAPLNAPLPPMRKWAIAPDFAILLYSLLMEYQPTTVVELGGGVSTVVTGYYFAQNEGGTVTAFDHHPLYTSLAQQNIETHQLIDVATVVHAPLSTIKIKGQTWDWYQASAFKAVPEIDFLTIDGPPQQDNPNDMVRYPALPILFDKLKSGAIILLDDAHRNHETRIVERWLEEFDVVKLREVDNEKGAVVLQKA